ncbi:hypothetical protein PR048_013174 [Dryococelus australis]|uniref:PID domain-containing protein n=1 Tax=Dryococelus australis TaxID=614101 RepID=A0ABQ9HS59_9NEOP|nr:hypothetical protein PR048_013174 [Dryococelus australis]
MQHRTGGDSWEGREIPQLRLCNVMSQSSGFRGLERSVFRAVLGAVHRKQLYSDAKTSFVIVILGVGIRNQLDVTMASPRMEPDSTPICRCRVLYLGSAVPHVTKDGLQGIQEPLRELYPEQGALGARGIDSWLSVWSNGLLLENVDENHKKVTRFFPIDTLHYCAAVRYVLVPEKAMASTSLNPSSPAIPRFLPLDSPFARNPNPCHPPLFSAILRRTTGIKVLECHAFICKREMAANALVRCCFHAYADSSYARHVDGAASASVYGTLRSQRDIVENSTTSPQAPLISFEKVEGWRRGGVGGGSVLTLNNSQQNHNGTLTSNTSVSADDDISIYNGDENHKVWAGSGVKSPTLGNEEFYGTGSGNNNTMRSGRPSRPRQVMSPVSSPPPPPPSPSKEDAKILKKASKEQIRRSKIAGDGRENMYPLMDGSLLRGSTVNMNGMRPSSSLGGTLMKSGVMPYHYNNNGMIMRSSSTLQLNGYNHQPAAPMILMQHPSATLPHPASNRQSQKKMGSGTFSHRKTCGGVIISNRPVLMPPPGAVLNTHPVLPPMPVGKKTAKHQVTLEEPIYMPSARPLSPVASFQPGHFPHEAYLMQQYASTMDIKPKKKQSKSVSKTSPKKGTTTANGVDEESQASAVILVDESPFNTGIYRKRGHLNERAFSYSIRQEHRSRSYGSLANLKFASPLPNGEAPLEASKEDLKKEREIMQMMHDLDLSGDELERSEVPAGMYENRRNVAIVSKR